MTGSGSGPLVHSFDARTLSLSNIPNVNKTIDMSESQRLLDDRRTKTTWSEFLQEEVTAEWGDLVLIVGCFATGLLDAAIFNVWQCFVSIQTGESCS